MNPRQHARDALHWLTPPGTFRQKARIHALRTIRRWLLPPRPSMCPRLPDWSDSGETSRYCSRFRVDVEFGDPERVEFWLDFHPHVLSLFPLATTPAERDAFIAWLLTHRGRFGLESRDILAFARELADDPSHGLDFLLRRNPAWQARHDLRSDLAPAGDWATSAVLPHEPPATRGVNILGHFCYPSGLQVAALNTKAALEGAGWTLSCRDVPVNMRTDLPGRRRWLGLHPHAATIVQLAPEPNGRNAYVLAGLRQRPGVRRIGYWYWELDTVPAAWPRHADWLDEIWAPTQFVGDALRRVMPIPVHAVLPGIAMPRPSAKTRTDFGLPEGYMFLFAFDMSSTAERKNPQAVIAAFRRAFSPAEPVRLVIKVSRGWEDAAALRSLRSDAEPGRIIVLDEVLPAEDMAALVNVCDSYVSLHRSEGFGLTLAEAMALGKPTIATRYSGNLDFMTDDNSLLVDCTMTTIAVRAKAYPRGARWAEPSIEDAARKMRWVVENPAEARATAERGRRDVLDRLSLDAAGRRMSDRLES